MELKVILQITLRAFLFTSLYLLETSSINLEDSLQQVDVNRGQQVNAQYEIDIDLNGFGKEVKGVEDQIEKIAKKKEQLNMWQKKRYQDKFQLIENEKGNNLNKKNFKSKVQEKINIKCWFFQKTLNWIQNKNREINKNCQKNERPKTESQVIQSNLKNQRKLEKKDIKISQQGEENKRKNKKCEKKQNKQKKKKKRLLQTCSILHCTTCSGTTCTACASGYYLDTGVCESCPSEYPNCATCTSSVCSTCQSGYTLASNHLSCTSSSGGTCTVANCATCSGTTCTACASGYYLDTGVCESCPSEYPNCATCTSSVCSTCQSGYTLASNQLSCTSSSGGTCSILHCTTCSGTTCTACASGYYLDTGVCESCPSEYPNCATCTSSVCSTCQSGYTLASNQLSCTSSSGGTCTVANCITCSGTTCTACASGYYLDTGVCESCPSEYPNCATCTSSVCSTCQSGYTLASNQLSCTSSSGGTCTVANCITCSGTTCTACASGYYLDTGVCESCPSEYPNCATCTSSVCSTCQSGYTLASNQLSCTSSSGGTCTVANCITCSGTTCTACASGYYLDTGVCESCPSEYPNCATCTSSICSTCQSGYTLASNQLSCTSSSGGTCSILHCTTCSGTTCTACASGYYLDTGVCVSCPSEYPNCATCTSSVCSTCQSGYTLASNQLSCTSSSGGTCTVANCITCSGTTCTACASGYYLDTGVCESCPSEYPNCATCTSSVCSTCQSGYTLASNQLSCTSSSGGTCTVANCITCSGTTCTACASGYYLDTGVCESCPSEYPNCATCTSSICSTCQSGYTLASNQLSCTSSSGGTCSILHCTTCSGTTCTACASGYYLDTGVCESCPSEYPNCATCTSSVCSTCQSGYTLASNQLSCTSSSGGTCTVANCITCSGTTCTACASGYYLDTGVCVSCPSEYPNCATCTSSVCSTCQSGYTLASNQLSCTSSSGGTCTVANCITCSGTTCTACASGYYLDTGVCVSCPSEYPNCATCTSSVCSTCQSGYTLASNQLSCTSSSGGTCTVANCITCSGTTCTACASGYYLDTGVCVSCPSEYPNCVTCTSSVCSTCQSGYTLASNQLSCTSSSGGTCTVANCITCSGTTCTACASGYYLDTGVCVSCPSEYPNCATCTSSVCSTCQSGYTLASNQLSCTSSSGGTCTVANCITCSGTTCTACASGYYLDTGVCVSCPSEYPNCATCTSSVCSTCQSGYTLASNQLSCTSSSGGTCTVANCITCSGTTCTACASGYYLDTGVCESCPSEYPNCATCTSSVCSTCQSGYTLANDQLLCFSPSFCGNFQLSSSEQCDDGNLISGDGCSQLCIIEPQFICQRSSTNNSFSICYFTGQISINKQFTRKTSFKNQIQIIYSVSHQSLSIWNSTNLNTLFQIASPVPISSYNVILNSDGTISIFVDYSQDIQGKNIDIILVPYKSGLSILSRLPPISHRLVILPQNNQIANFYTDNTYKTAKIIQIMSLFIIGLSGLFFILGIISGKMIGIQMMGSIQISYFSLMNLGQMNPCFSALSSLRFINGYNSLGSNPLSDPLTPNSPKGIFLFSRYSENFNITSVVVVIPMLISLISYILYKTLLKNNQKVILISKKAIGQYTLMSLLFCGYLNAVSFGLQVIYGRNNQTDLIGKLSIFQCSILTILMVAYFVLMLIKPQIFGEFVKSFSKIRVVYHKYYNWVIIQRFIVGISIIFLLQSKASCVFPLVIFILFGAFVIVFRPHVSELHRVRVISNFAILVIIEAIYLSYQVESPIARGSNPTFFYLPLVVCILLLICVIYNAISILYFLVKKCKKKAKSKQQESENYEIQMNQKVVKFRQEANVYKNTTRTIHTPRIFQMQPGKSQNSKNIMQLMRQQMKLMKPFQIKPDNVDLLNLSQVKMVKMELFEEYDQI